MVLVSKPHIVFNGSVVYQKIFKNLCVVLLFFSIFLLAVPQIYAANFYVETNGNDSASGSSSAPFKTITHGVKQLKPGDTLIVGDGVYAESLDRVIPYGEPGKPVTLRAKNPRKAIIRPNPGSRFVIIMGTHNQKNSEGKYISADRYITIEGFVLDGVNIYDDVVRVSGATIDNVAGNEDSRPHHISIINNEIMNAAGHWRARIHEIDFTGKHPHFNRDADGPWGHGISNSYVNDVVIRGNDLHHNGLTDFDHGVYHFGHEGVIENNRSYQNAGTGLKVGWGESTRNIHVRYNTVYDNNRVMENVSKGKNGTGPTKIGGRGIGVYRGTGNMVYNNVIWGAHFSGIDVTYDSSNIRVFNNTIYAQLGAPYSWGITAGGGSSTFPDGRLQPQDVKNVEIKNNIIYQDAQHSNLSYTNPIEIGSRADGVVIEGNLVFGKNQNINVVKNAVNGGSKNVTVGSNVIGQDPQFTNISQRNFSLRNTSPAINAGLSLSLVQDDFNRVSRPQGSKYDIGAYEFGGVAVTPVVTATLANSPTPVATSTLTPTPIPQATATQPPAGTTVQVINATADLYVDGASPNENFGTSNILAVDGDMDTVGDSINIIYLKFDTGSMTSNAIQRAYLRLRVHQTPSSSGSVDRYPLRTVASTGWGELNTTYQNKPARGAQIAEFGPLGLGQVVDIDITQTLKETPAGLISFAIDSTGSDGLFLMSKETDSPPQLIVELSENTVCVGDLNGDKTVDLADYSMLINNFFSTNPNPASADLNGDGVVDLTDYSTLVTRFFQNCI